MTMTPFPTPKMPLNTHMAHLPLRKIAKTHDEAQPYAGVVAPHWQAEARLKGFEITGRIRDRYHLALRCHACSHVHESRIYTLMSAQPQCPACMIARLQEDADAAGLTHIDRDPGHRHYSLYAAPCGHTLRRQHEIIRRAASGSTDLRCDVCHAARAAKEASDRGWMLIGADPQGDVNYRLYQHANGCGASQRIARANMQTGRFDCTACGVGWASAQSFLYAMRFTLASGRELVKLGFSRDPESRLLHQLQIDRAMPCKVLRTVPMPSGRAALSTEKRMHARIRRHHPGAMVNPQAYRKQIRVGSEIYDATLTSVVLAMLDGVSGRAPRH